MENFYKVIDLIAEELIQTNQVEWHYEDDILDYGDDGNGFGYQAKPIQTLIIDDMPEIFVDEELQVLDTSRNSSQRRQTNQL